MESLLSHRAAEADRAGEALSKTDHASELLMPQISLFLCSLVCLFFLTFLGTGRLAFLFPEPLDRVGPSAHPGALPGSRCLSRSSRLLHSG